MVLFSVGLPGFSSNRCGFFFYLPELTEFLFFSVKPATVVDCLLLRGKLS